MPKPKRPMKPFKGSVFNVKLSRWEGKPVVIVNTSKSKLRKAFSGAMNFISPRFKRLKPKSEKQKKEDALYEKIKPVWRANPKHHYCQAVCKDNHLRTPALPYPHHRKGRGKLLCDVAFFLPVCETCHTFIHAHPALSYKRGWMVKR